MKGLIYYEDSGQIVGVSFFPSDELGQYPHIEAEYEAVEPFMSGAAETSDWSVMWSPDRRTRRLVPNRFPLKKKKGLVRFAHEGTNATGMVLMVTLPSEGRTLEVRLINRLKRAQVFKGAADNLELTLTDSRAELDGVKCRVKVDLYALTRNRSIIVPLPQAIRGSETAVFAFESLEDIGCEIRVSSTSEVDIEPREALTSLPLPRGRQEQLVEIKPLPGKPSQPSVILVVENGHVEVCMFQGGGLPYDRDVSSMALTLTQPGDPDAILATQRIDLKDQHRTPFVDLPERFSLYGQRMYENMFYHVRPKLDGKFGAEADADILVSVSGNCMLVDSRSGLGHGSIVLGKNKFPISYGATAIYPLPKGDLKKARFDPPIAAALVERSDFNVAEGMITSAPRRVDSVLGISRGVVFDLDSNRVGISIIDGGGPRTSSSIQYADIMIHDEAGTIEQKIRLNTGLSTPLPRTVQGEFEFEVRMPYLTGYLITTR